MPKGEKHGCCTHGGSFKHPVEYKTWKRMRRRCLTPSSSSFKYYGERGIKICERWDDFPNFLADMGKRPDGYTLERKDNDKDYSPENCKWATQTEQMNNTRANVVLTHEGVTMNISQWAVKLNIAAKTLHARRYRGWDTARILSPVKHTGNRWRNIHNV